MPVGVLVRRAHGYQHDPSKISSVGTGLTLRVGKLRYEPLAETGAVAALAILLVFRPATGAIFSTTPLLPERLLVISRHAATKASLRTAWKALFSEGEF
jgi:hypothetical protein